MRMADHSTEVTWHFVVPPSNTTRLTIMQRQDGPFRGDRVGGHDGHYYTSVERLDLRTSKWEHVAGSSTGGHGSYSAAYGAAEARWRELSAAPSVASGAPREYWNDTPEARAARVAVGIECPPGCEGCNCAACELRRKHEAAAGVQACATCHGTGANPAWPLANCPACTPGVRVTGDVQTRNEVAAFLCGAGLPMKVADDSAQELILFITTGKWPGTAAGVAASPAAEPLTVIRHRDTHEWRLVKLEWRVGDPWTWELHYLPTNNGLRYADEFEDQLLNEAKRLVDTARGVKGGDDAKA